MSINRKFFQMVLGAVVIVYAGCGVAAEIKAADNSATVASTAVNKVSAEELYKISSNDMVMGSDSAKVTVIEYASMTCPHCADFHKNTFPEVKEKYVDTGKVKFVFRSFPLDEPALRASMLAYCAGKDRFFKFIDVLFTTQTNWSLNKNYLEVLANIGKLGGMSGDEFDKCIANKDLEKRIMQGKFDATTALSLRSTPSFFVNGNLYKGAHNFEFFSKVLDESLGEKPKDATLKEEMKKDAVPAKAAVPVESKTK